MSAERKGGYRIQGKVSRHLYITFEGLYSSRESAERQAEVERKNGWVVRVVQIDYFASGYGRTVYHPLEMWR